MSAPGRVREGDGQVWLVKVRFTADITAVTLAVDGNGRHGRLPGLDFINVLRTAFTPVAPQSVRT